ncbi:unnamed protein product [Leuciscus chuanchicus]
MKNSETAENIRDAWGKIVKEEEGTLGARFHGLGGSTAVGRGSADRRECKAAVDRGGSMVKTLCGSCWECAALDGRDVMEARGREDSCLG